MSEVEASNHLAMPGPLVSVIIPAYNSVRFLAETIGSVQAQTWTDWEVIVVDDGSDDDTAQLMATLQHDSRVRYLPRPHLGVSASRNHGIESARGDFVAFLDSDDLWTVKEKLEIQVELLLSRPDVGWIFGEERFVFAAPKGRTIEVRNRHLHPPQSNDPVVVSVSILELCSAKFTVPTSSVMVRRSCFESTGGFDPELHAYEDLDMWIKLNREFAVAFFPRILVDRKKREESLSRSRFKSSKNLQRVSDRHSIHRELAAEWMHYHFARARLNAAKGNLLAAGMAFVKGLKERRVLRRLSFPAGRADGSLKASGAL